MAVTLSKKDNIEMLWGKLKNNGSKTEMIKLCAGVFKRSEKTIRQYWFSKLYAWSVPEEFQDQVISILQNKINSQNKH